MLDEYPKALYRGDKQAHEHVIVDGEELEERLRSTGYVDYLDLDDAVPENYLDIKNAADVLEEIDLDAYVPIDKFDSLAEKLTETEEQLKAKGIELEQGKDQIKTIQAQHAEVVVNLEGEINRLKAELASFPEATGIPQDVYDAVYQEREQLLKENVQLKYSAMGANELMAILDEKGIKYGSRDPKEALVKLALDTQFPAI